MLCFARVPMAERVTGGRPQHGRVGKHDGPREELEEAENYGNLFLALQMQLDMLVKEVQPEAAGTLAEQVATYGLILVGDMGTYDGTEICELVGLYLLSKLETLLGKGRVGLYRDDGLSAISGRGREIDCKRKKLIEIFKTEGLKITVVCGTWPGCLNDLYS